MICVAHGRFKSTEAEGTIAFQGACANQPHLTGIDSRDVISAALMRSLSERNLHKRWRRLCRLLAGQEHFKNREGRRDFDFTLLKESKRQGVSALVRARNEEQKINHCLRSIIDVFDEVVFVDNGSEDGTLAIVKRIKEKEDRGDRLRICDYPFKLARFGSEHDRMPENSVHSAVYYSNWGIAQCSFAYVCKWDGDMVLRKEAKQPLMEHLGRLHDRAPQCWTLPGQTIYRDLKRDYYHLAKGEINKEIMLFPYGFNPRFYKDKHWECLKCRPRLPVSHFLPVTFYELKFVDENEFSHWSTNDWPSERKKREWANFHDVKAGNCPGDRFEKLPATFLDDQLT